MTGKPGRSATAPAAVNRISPVRFIVGFGIVSALADVVYEGARSIIGPCLGSLGATAAVVGLITGAGEAAALVLRLFTGRIADRLGKPWPLTMLGGDSVYKNMTTFLVEKEPGFGETRPGLSIPGKIDKMGYKGVETTEMVLDGVRVPTDRILGGEAGRGRGFYQLMDGVEVGRVNVAARACGISIRAFELAIQYVQQRKTFGKQIVEHQAIAFKLAEMATKVEAAHGIMVNAARLKGAGERNDVEVGMAKLIASEYCAEVTQESFRIHGGYGYSKEYEIERLMRGAPFLLIGEGTSEIQKTIISRGLLREYRL
jgi:alkylation response protein AidB-like acyl-CoA dehydrogenase